MFVLFRQQILMKTKIATNWFLFGFLTLFLGLGPAAHHADFLGLHSHGHSHSGCSHSHHSNLAENGGSESDREIVGSASASSCSCDHHESTTETTNEERLVEWQVSPFDGQSECQFCKFFEDFQVIIDVWELGSQSILSTPSRRFEAESAKLLSCKPIARGPPIAS